MCDLQEDVEERLVVDSKSPAAARQLVDRVARHEHVDADERQVAVLLTSEAVTNVVLHTGSTLVTVRVTCDGRGLTVRVHDQDPTLPSPQHPDVTSDSGRGLLLIRDLAVQWGSEPRPDGKIVWFRTATHS